MKPASLCAVATALVFAAATATAGPLAETALKTSESAGDAVVTLKIAHTISMSFGGQTMNERENAGEARGTVISADGLVVAPLSEVDPAIGFQRMWGAQMGPNDSFDAKIKELKYILPDNTEIDAAIVLRDSDLDLAFLRPKKAEDRTYAFVDFSKNESAQVLDEVFAVGRMGSIGRRGVLALTGEIQGVIDRPRKFYVMSSELSSAGLGVPVFTQSGAALGIVSIKMSPTSGQGSGPESMEVILPAADIVDSASQAPKEAPAEEAPAAPAETPAADPAAAEPAEAKSGSE